MSKPSEPTQRLMASMVRIMERPKLSLETVDALLVWAHGSDPLDTVIRAALIDALSDLRIRKTLG